MQNIFGGEMVLQQESDSWNNSHENVSERFQWERFDEYVSVEHFMKPFRRTECLWECFHTPIFRGCVGKR
jgi:hypothetical protein